MSDYKAMYVEYCMEGGFQISPEGFTEFVAWRKRVEKFLARFNERMTVENRSDSS